MSAKPAAQNTARRICVFMAAAALLPAASSEPPGAPSQWEWYGADAAGTRSSPLAMIDRDNVQNLEIAWTYRTGELGENLASARKLTFETTPILVEGTLYLSTATNIVIALDPATGGQRWRFDPQVARDVHYSEVVSRGVASWRDATASTDSPCAHRILIGTLGAQLYALDGRSGQPCADFGNRGSLDLGKGTRAEEPTGNGNYLVTSPPAIYKDLVIVGSAIGDNRAAALERGIVRAFDVRSGELRWSFDPIPATDEDAATLGWSTAAARRTGAANAWAPMSVDQARGLVFVPTGSASPDFFGGERPGENRHANSLLALRADTGELAWHRQLVHHDLWDYDLAAQPLLVELEREGRLIAAVVQATKTGLLFVFDRETGESVFEIVERPVPQSDVAGESSSPTQPFPATPALTSHAAVAPQDAWGLTFYDRGRCRKLIRAHRSEGIYTPPTLRGTIMRPGYAGGVNWGGLAYDIERQLAITAVNHLPMVVTLVPREQYAAARKSGRYPDAEFSPQEGTPYGMRRELLASPFGLPCTSPPWGTLAAIDLKNNAIRWQVPLGSTRDKTPWFVPALDLGMPHMGGPMVTAGGLVFIAATTDDYLRAFDVDTGRQLWKGRLPAGGQATPMSYLAGGRQFVVVAAGGHGALGTRRGDHVVAFALPPENRAQIEH